MRIIKNKKLIIGSVIAVIILIVGGSFFIQYTEKVQEEQRIEAERIKEEERIAAEKAAEEARIAAEKAAEEERKRKEEEERKKQELIKTSTYYTKKQGATVYEALDKIEGEEGLVTYSLNTPVHQMNYKDSVFVEEFVEEQYAVIKSSYDGEIIGYADINNFVKDKTDFIYMTYEDADYEPYEKTQGYESNPMRTVKGIFVTGYSASEGIDRYIDMISDTELNAMVIDVKDDNGNLLFDFEGREEYGVENVQIYSDNIDEIVQKCKDNDIYLIARIVAFKSPKYASTYPERSIVYKGTNQVYSYSDGTAWASAHDRHLWDYNIDIAKAAAEAGFNEIQFDYVRFPDISQGIRNQLDFRNYENESRTATIQSFLKKSQEELKPYEVYIAADVFGWVATAVNDQGIGQHWEAITNVVDYMCPMVYPSHYGPGIFGYDVPNANPYGTVYNSIKDAQDRDSNMETPAKLRPWIQDFDWGGIDYGVYEINEQIRALNDLGVEDFLLWGSGVVYTLDGFVE